MSDREGYKPLKISGWNWSWMRHRLRQSVRCWHRWMPGLTNWPAQEIPPIKIQACSKCGVWRWFPRFKDVSE